MECQSLFSGENKEKFISVSYAELAQEMTKFTPHLNFKQVQLLV